MIKIKISGGIFYALLSEIKLSDENISNRMNGATSPCTNLDLIHALGAIIGTKYTANQIVKKTASSYKTCEGQGGLGFDTVDCCNYFNVGITKHYPELYKRTELMLQKCIVNDKDSRKSFISKVLYFIQNATNLGDVYFYYPDASNKMTPSEFVSLKKYDFVAFVLAVWQSLIFNVTNNRVASDTFEEYFEMDYSRSEYIFKSEYESKLRTDFEAENILSAAEEIIVDESEFEDSSSENSSKNNIDYYNAYISNCVDKVSKLKTILYSKQPIDFYKVYVCNDICLDTDFKDPKKDYDNPLKSATPKSLIKRYGNFLTLSAPGGYGKSMFLKHMMLCEHRFKDADWMDSTGLVPVLLTLKDFKKRHDSIDSFIFERMKKYDPELDESVIKKDFSKGIFMFLFDALDEVNNDLLDDFITQLNDFSDQYDSNVFILSSRPNSLCDSLTSFTALKLMFFREQQGEKLINHFIDFDESKRKEFNKKTFNSPTSRYSSSNIEGNPLLLTIKFMVYIQTGKLVKSGSAEFFDEAYEALYITHDQIHNQFSSRVYKTGLDIDALKNVIAEFCFKSYMKFKYSFTRNEIDEIIEEMDATEKFNLSTTAFIKDLKDNLSLFVVEDGNYSFIHRNFQQYFAAYYISKRNKSFFTPELINQIDNYSNNRHSSDQRKYSVDGKKFIFIFHDCEISTVIDMAHQIKPDKVEKYIFLPVLNNVFEKFGLQNYVSKVYGKLSYGNGLTYNNEHNYPSSEILSFIIDDALELDASHDLHSGPDIERLVEEYFYQEQNGDLSEEFEKRQEWANDDLGYVDVEPNGVTYTLDPLDFDENSSDYDELYSFLEDNFIEEMNAVEGYRNDIINRFGE